MDKLTLALDWTPNINHVAFFLAQAEGLYEEVGLDVVLLNPADDGYATTPAKKVETGVADLALCPTESLLSYQTKAQPLDLVGVAALFREDLSAVAVLEDTDIERPSQLDGKHYASYQARYEDGIVRQMIRNNGGKGDLQISYPAKLGIWETLLSGKADATWIFVNWEGVQAAANGVALQLFRLKDYDIPYSYSPVLAASRAKVQARESVFAKFVEATRKAVGLLAHEPERVAVLQPHLPAKDQSTHLAKAWAATRPAMSPNDWGHLDPQVVQQFLDWLAEQGLEQNPIPAEQLLYPLA